MFEYTNLIVIGVVALLVIITIIGLLSRYRKCASDELLIVFGKAGKMKTADGQTVNMSAKIYNGGGTFVIPIIQDYKTMSLRPMEINREITGLSKQNINVTIPFNLITQIGNAEEFRQNAARSFLTANSEEIRGQLESILTGEIRAIMAQMDIEEINGQREQFLKKAKESLEPELNKVGFTIVNLNLSNIKDDANYIENLGKKAATQAQAQAKADIAEQEKLGAVRIATTKKEQAIQLAEQEKEERITVAITTKDTNVQVAQTQQEEEVKRAQIRKDQQIQLATAEKEESSGVALQQAEQIANVAEADANAESAKAASKAKQAANIAKAEAEAESKKAEALAEQNTRIAIANQEYEANKEKAIQDQQAKVAEYTSQKEQRQAKAEQDAGVAKQNATIKVSEAKAEAAKAAAEAIKVEKVATIEANMTAEKTQQERQLEVNEAQAKAIEVKYKAEKIIPAQKAKEEAIITAEAEKQKVILAAEAEASKVEKQAEAEAKKVQLTKTAEAEGTKKVLLAEAEGKKALLLAEAEQAQQIALAPAMAVERMIESGMTPDMIVQYMSIDKIPAVAEAQKEAYEHIHLDNVVVYGDTNTAADFMGKVAKNLNIFDRSGIQTKVQELLGTASKSISKPQTADDLDFEDPDKK